MSESPESQRLCDFAWLRATNGGEAQGYPPIVRRLLAAHDDVEDRLAEATALLERCRRYIGHNPNGAGEAIVRDIGAMVSRAPAQPAAPTVCAEHDVPLANEAFFKCGCRYLSQPAAPEPGAETIAFWRHFRDEASFPSTIRKGKEWQARAESAEAQLAVLKQDNEAHVARCYAAEARLAAVREIGHDQRLTPHQRWERIMALLSPPSVTATEEPVATEPSADRVALGHGVLPQEYRQAISDRARRVAAEAQLAAVNEIVQTAERRAGLYPGLKGSTYYAAYLEILAVLVRRADSTPSHSAVPGEEP